MPLTNPIILLDRDGNFISGSAAVPVSGSVTVQGPVATGSLFQGFPDVVGGVSAGGIVRALQTDVSGAAYITSSGSLPVTGSLALTEAVRLVSGSVTKPFSVEPTGGRRTILSGAVVSSNGNAVLTWQGWSEWYLICVASGSVSGASPKLQFKIEEVDPIDQVTVVGQTITGSLMSASGQFDVLQITDTLSDTLKISWTVTGTTPIFSGVNVSWVGHAAGNAIEGQTEVGELMDEPPVPVAGVDSTTRVRYIQVDSAGAVIVASQGSNATNGYRFGDIALSAITSSIPVYHTTYNEPTASVRRSVVSTSTNDKPGDTGAAKVIITYYDLSGSGPFTEEVQLNGTTAANTTASMAYIESMNVSFVGSVGSNVGTISLKNLINGAGVTVASIGVNESQTALAHHYVPLGKTCNITDMSVGINAGGGLFWLAQKPINVTGSVELKITEQFREAAQSPTSTRNFNTPVKVVGPARIRMYVTSEAGTSLVYRGAFNFYDQVS